MRFTIFYQSLKIYRIKCGAINLNLSVFLTSGDFWFVKNLIRQGKEWIAQHQWKGYNENSVAQINVQTVMQ